MRILKYIVLFFVAQLVANQYATAQSHTHFPAQLTDTLYIYFKVGNSQLNPQYRNNSATLNFFEKFLPDNINQRLAYTLNGITLQGSASPEGRPHLDRILATSRANTTAQYIKNKYLVNQEIIKIDNIYINTGASRAIWPDLRNARIIVDYTRVSKDVPLLQTTQMANKVQAMVAKAETKSAQPQIKTLLVKAEGKQKASKDFRIALKTNALYDILLTPNVGMEIPVYKNWSVAANWMYAWWKADPNSWYHRIYGGDIEVRRYIRQWPWSKANGTGKANENGKASCTPLAGWHIGVYAQMLTYDFEWGGTGNLGDKWSYAAGVAAGYSKNIAPRLNLDFTLGVGYLTGEYMEYKPIDNCYVWQATKQRHWIGPTKAEVSLVWLLGKW